MQVWTKVDNVEQWLDIEQLVKQFNEEKRRQLIKDQKEIINHDLNDIPRSIRNQ